MSVRVKLNLPRGIWTAKDTKTIASNTLATVKRRTMKGISSKGNKFKKYSTTPLYVAFQGARLKPKGGTRLSRTGKSIYYAGGYQQYKEDSRKRRGGQGQTAEVDLVLSGQLDRLRRHRRGAPRRLYRAETQSLARCHGHARGHLGH